VASKARHRFGEGVLCGRKAPSPLALCRRTRRDGDTDGRAEDFSHAAQHGQGVAFVGGRFEAADVLLRGFEFAGKLLLREASLFAEGRQLQGDVPGFFGILTARCATFNASTLEKSQMRTTQSSQRKKRLWITRRRGVREKTLPAGNARMFARCAPRRRGLLCINSPRGCCPRHGYACRRMSCRGGSREYRPRLDSVPRFPFAGQGQASHRRLCPGKKPEASLFLSL
jgi:hypothetical protein